MENGLILFLSLLLFACCSRFLMSSIRVAAGNTLENQTYSRQAQRVEKAYKIFAWSLLALVLFISMVESFWQTFILGF